MYLPGIGEQVDPRQRLAILFRLCLALEKLERFQEIPPLFMEAIDTVRILVSMEEFNR